MTLAVEALYTAEIQVYDPALGTTRTLYFASGNGFTTKPSETPANTFFAGCIAQPVDISRTMFSGGNTTGRSTEGIGDLILANPDGLLDYLNELGFDGRSVVVRRSTVASPSYPSDFTSYTLTQSGHPDLSSTDIRFKLRDRQEILASTPYQTTKYAGTNVLPAGLEGVATDLKGKPKPVTLGTVKNVPAPCVNTSKLIYQINDGAIASVDAVYDRGSALTPSRTWNRVAAAVAAGGVGPQIYAATYGNGLFIIGSQNGFIYSSADGITWTQRATGIGIASCAAYGNGNYVVVSRSAVYTSTNGTAWTARALLTASDASITYSTSAALFVVADQGGNIWTSPTGVTWTSRTAPGPFFYGAAYGGGLTVLVGAGGVAYTSKDCITWTQRAIAFGVAADKFTSVTYGNNYFVAVGSGFVARSPDGITWTRVTITGTLAGVVFCGGGFVASYDTAGALYTSADGLTWAAQTISSLAAVSLQALATDGTKIVGTTIDGSGDVYYTTNATYANTTDLQDDTKAPLAGEYIPCLGSGYIRLGYKATGLLTVDATQGTTAADRTAAQLFKLVLARASLTSSTTDYSTADITALDLANSAVLGHWTMDETFCADVIDLIGSSVWAWWAVDKSGVVRIKQFTAPSGTAVKTFTDAADLKAPLERVSTNDVGDGVPIYKCTVRWGRYFATLTSDIATGVSDAARAAFVQEWRDTSSTDATVLAAHPLSQPMIEESLLTTEADALAEAVRREAIRGVKRDRFELVAELNSETDTIDMGDVVGVINARFALALAGSTNAGELFDSGALFRVLDVRPDGGNKTVTFTLWGRAVGWNIVSNTGVYVVSNTGVYGVTSRSA